MTSMRKRGASGYDDDDVENHAFLSDASLSKSKPMITKKNDYFQKLFQRTSVMVAFVVIFILSFIGALKGRLNGGSLSKHRKIVQSCTHKI
jgi:hypothetical protein